MGIPVVEAPCEAEATCAHLAKTGNCYAAATEDADALCFGATKLVRNLFSTDIKKKPVLEIELARVLEQLNLDMTKFLDFCILCGCDYTDTITCVGSMTAIQLVQTHGSIENILEIAVAKEKVPSNFPFDEARKLFLKHEVVDVNEKDELTGAKKYDFHHHFASRPKADIEALKKFLIEENQFNEERISRSLHKLQTGLNVGMPMSFDSFFTVEAPIIKQSDKFDPFTKRGGQKRANRTGALKEEKVTAKKRKGALTADKIEAQQSTSASSSSSSAVLSGNGGNGIANSS